MRVDGRDIGVSGNLLQPLTRRTNDIIRAVLAAIYLVAVITSSLITRPQWVALEKSISEIVGVLSPSQSDLVYLGYGLAILALPFVILIGLIVSRQWKLLGAYAAAGLMAVLPLSISSSRIAAPRWHFDLSDRLATLLAQFLDDPRWIAMLAAVLTVSGPWLPARWRHWWWALLLAFVPIHLVVSAIVPARSLLGLAVGWLVGALVLVLVYKQFRGEFTPKTELTMVASRAGLVMEAGSKVTYNGVEIGRVGSISEIERDGRPAAKLVLDVNPRYISLIPVNVVADIEAATLFGNKYVALSAPKIPQQQRISSHDVIDVGSVTTEFNTLFETITSIAEKVDPIELNATLSAVAQALDGLGGKFGESIVNGNQILAQLNPRLPQLGYDVRRLADLGEVYVDASPDLWSFLQNALTTARTLTSQQRDLDAALLAATGAGNTGEDVFARGGPYLARAAADLVPTATLLDTYSPELFCMIRNFHDAAPKVADAVGGNGYSLAAAGTILGAPNPYVYPDNLPRVNAHGGPGGRPGCWQTITRELWPAPYLVMDTGASLAPYNHVELGQPMFTEYVWGRQYGENTINP